MEDTISRQAAIDVLNKLADIKYTHMPYYGYYLGALHDAANDIKALPSVQERKGRWVELYDSNYKCSECGAWWHSDDMDINEEFQFCPNCGCAMTEGAEDDKSRNPKV